MNTKQNPADLASRGVNSIESLSQSMWLSGPDFLWNSALPEKLSVSGVEQFEVDQNDPELKKEVHVVVSHDTCVDTQAEYLLDLCCFKDSNPWHFLHRKRLLTSFAL